MIATKQPHDVRASDRRAWVIGVGGLLATAAPFVAHTQSMPSSSQAKQSATSPYPARLLDRPTTLPRGDSRLDVFALVTHVPQSPTTVTMVLGGGFGVSNQLEIGGELVPFEAEPGIVFTNPSAYATYAFQVSKTTAIAPTIQLVYPLKSEDPFTVDVGAPIYVNIGSWGYLTFAPTFSLNTRGDEQGTSLSLPVTLMRQSSEQLNFQVTSGVGLSRFDPRFGLSRRSEALDFDELTVPAAALVTYTLARGSPRSALADLTLQFQWPQLYTRAPSMRGAHTDDWAIQIQSSWYFIH